MEQRNLPSETVRALESGFNKHLNRSIVYSPFRFFFNLFKKSNPKTMDRARNVIREDITKILAELDGFDETIFIIKSNQVTPAGKEFLTVCYNIGINVLKKELTVMLAFKALRDAELRDQTYGDVLEKVQNAAFEILDRKLLESQKTLPKNDEDSDDDQEKVDETQKV